MNEQTTNEPKLEPMDYILQISGEPLLMAGPLAEAYTHGLNELYAKDKETGFALETQAVDVGMLRQRFLLLKKPNLDGRDRAALGLFYGVQKGSLRTSQVVDVLQSLRTLSGQAQRKSVVVVDAVIKAVPGVGFKEVKSVSIESTNHLESMLRAECEKMGVRVFSSFEEFALCY